METDSGEVQAELPQTLDEEAFLQLDLRTLVFIVTYFNNVLTVLIITLAVATFGAQPTQVITNIEDGAMIAKGITELAVQALRRKVDDQDDG
jgi:hypothetical protein